MIQQDFHLVGLEHRRRTFYKYEKRIREYSPPEKIFEYFASAGNEHSGFTMTASDMLRSVAAVYPPSGSGIIRAGSLPGEPDAGVTQEPSSFFLHFDVDGNGIISFDEFLLFRVLLAMPIHQLEACFKLVDKNGSGAIDQEEFRELMSLTAGAARPTHSVTRHSVKNLTDAKGGLLEHFFEGGKRQLTMATFSEFLLAMREEMGRLEFAHYDFSKRGFMTGTDFAHGVVGTVRLKHLDSYLDLIDKMPDDLAKAHISYDEFLTFRRIIEQLQSLYVAMDFWEAVHGKICKQDLTEIIDRVLGKKLSSKQIDILFYLFTDQFRQQHGGDASFNVNFFYQVMNRHWCTGTSNAAHMMGRRSSEPANRGFMECLSRCMQQQ